MRKFRAFRIAYEKVFTVLGLCQLDYLYFVNFSEGNRFFLSSILLFQKTLFKILSGFKQRPYYMLFLLCSCKATLKRFPYLNVAAGLPTTRVWSVQIFFSFAYRKRWTHVVYEQGPVLVGNIFKFRKEQYIWSTLRSHLRL